MGWRFGGFGALLRVIKRGNIHFTTAAALAASALPALAFAQSRPPVPCLMGFAAAADSSPAVVYGHADLRRALPPGEDREVRITESAGLALQRYTLRLVARGPEVFGELLISWPTTGYHRVVQGPRDCGGSTDAEDARLARLVARDAFRTYGCREVITRGVFQFCQARFRSEPQWARVLQHLDALGVGTVPDPATLTPAERPVGDGSGIQVELRDGTGYRDYQYRNPQAQPWPEARAAVQIEALVLEMVSSAGPP